MTLIFRLIIQRDIWIFHSKVFSSVYFFSGAKYEIFYEKNPPLA